MMTAIVGGSTVIGTLMGVFKTKEEKPKANIKNETLRRGNFFLSLIFSN